MQNTEDLQPEERQNLDEQLRIASREAEIMENMTIMPGSPPGLSDVFMKNIMDFEDKWDAQPATSVGDRLGEHAFVDVDGLTEEAAESAVIDLLNALAQKNIRIDGPEMITATEFYRWLRDHFIKEEISMPIGDGWNVNYIYSELVPEGPDAMNFIVKTFIDDLFRLDFDFNPWTLETELLVNREGELRSQLRPDLNRYVTAWRDAIQTVADYQYNPVQGVRIGEKLAEFTFQVACTLVREDGHRDTFSGSGKSILSYDGHFWSIKSINFPGFDMLSAGRGR